MKDEELIKRAIGLHETIYKIECFGTSDLMNYELFCKELERRGYQLAEKSELKVIKNEDY